MSSSTSYQSHPPPPPQHPQTPSLTSLPPEILRLIIQHLLPKAQTFRLKSVNPTPPTQQPGYRQSWHKSYYDWTTQTEHCTTYSPLPKSILPLLKTHRTIYRLVTTDLYTQNTLSLPDVYTLTHYVTYFTSTTLSSLKTLSIDLRGAAITTKTCTTRSTHFAHQADPTVVDAIRPLAALRDLRLWGVGPGVQRYLNLGTRTQRYMCRREDRRMWVASEVRLVAEIVGVEGDDYGEGVSIDSYTPGPLVGGRVFHFKVMPGDELGSSTGRLRAFGTRIVHPDFVVEVGPLEEEMVDVRAALARAVADAEVRKRYEGGHPDFGEMEDKLRMWRGVRREKAEREAREREMGLVRLRRDATRAVGMDVDRREEWRKVRVTGEDGDE